MKAEPSRHVLLIDYLRGIAIISVFLYHCLGPAYFITGLPWNWLRRDFGGPASFIALLPAHFGNLGVPMFFVISGFCIHLSFKLQGQEWKSFFTRRFFRLYPAYLLTLLLFLLFRAHDLREFWFQFSYHVLLIQNFNTDTIGAVNGCFWSIAVEVQLYLIYPVLLWLVGRFGWKRTLAIVATCEIVADLSDTPLFGLTIYLGNSVHYLFWKLSLFMSDFFRPGPLGYWFSWSLGAYAADAYMQRRPLPLVRSSLAFWGFIVIASYFLALLAPFYFLFGALLTTKILSKYLTPVHGLPHEQNLWLKWLRQIGLYSYSIYLIHLPMLEGLAGLIRKVDPDIWPFLVFSLCVCSWIVVMPLAGLCYRFVEQPGIAFGRRVIQKMAQRTIAPPQAAPATVSSEEKIEG